MLTAAQARAKSQNDLVIFNEVRDIEESIITASADGSYEVTITGTTMCTSSGYYNVWQGATPDRAKEKQMAMVVQYFTDMGYVIERHTNPSTGTTFNWVIYW